MSIGMPFETRSGEIPTVTMHETVKISSRQSTIWNSMTNISNPPDWFCTAIAQPAVGYYAPGNGGRIHYRCWNAHDVSKPGLLLAHGYRGHSHWWDFIAPFFTDLFRVYALDFAGMGDSDYRTVYDAEGFTDNLLEVLDHAGLAQTTLVGHSYGGTRVLRACAEFPNRIAHAIILDSYVNFADVDHKPALPKFGNPTPYPDLSRALGRFRLLPEQPSEEWARKYIARHSLRKVNGGWNWKFDHQLPPANFEMDGAALLARIPVPVDIVCGEHSSVLQLARAQRTVASLKNSSRVRGPIVIPHAYHHFMLDQPLALVTALRSLLA